MKLWLVEQKIVCERKIRAVVLAEHETAALTSVICDPLKHADRFSVIEIDQSLELLLLKVDEQRIYDDGYYQDQLDQGFRHRQGGIDD